jgi:hypothetical protein
MSLKNKVFAYLMREDGRRLLVDWLPDSEQKVMGYPVVFAPPRDLRVNVLLGRLCDAAEYCAWDSESPGAHSDEDLSFAIAFTRKTEAAKIVFSDDAKMADVDSLITEGIKNGDYRETTIRAISTLLNIYYKAAQWEYGGVRECIEEAEAAR